MYSGTLAFFVGILSVNFLHLLFTSSYFFFISLLLLLLSYLTKKYCKIISLHLAFYFLGFAWILFNCNLQLQNFIPTESEGKNVFVEGVIRSIPEVSLNNIRFEFDIYKIEQQSLAKPLRVRLSWFYASQAVHQTDLWGLTIRLKRPHGFYNEGSFHLNQWYFQQRIVASGTVITNSSNRLIKKNQNSFLNVREFLDKEMNDHLKNVSQGGLIPALAIGMREKISQPDWQVFRATGTSHLVAISGLHIGLMAGFFYFLVNYLWRYCGQISLWFSSQRAAAIAAILAAFIYSALAGFSIPTQRALIMIACLMLTRLTQRYSCSNRGFLIALLIILLWDPLAIFSQGFWLSFAAVGIIAFGMSGRIAAGGLWWKWGRTQWVVTLGLFPISLWFFQQLSLVSMMANFIAIPWVGFLVVPLCLLGSLLLFVSPYLADFILKSAAFLLQILWPFLKFMAGLHYAVWFHGIPAFWIVIMASIGVLVLLLPQGFPARWMGGFWILPLFFFNPDKPKANEMWFTVLDVGQGLATIVRTYNHVLIYDTGPKSGPDFDAGSNVVIPYLQMSGIKRVDTIVISHGDNDHSGGLLSLQQSFPEAAIITSIPEKFPSKNMTNCHAGMRWIWDGVEFAILHPEQNQPYVTNNSSCVLKVSLGKHHILLPGDIEKESEGTLINKFSELKADILVAPHHGSRTSSTLKFIETVAPEYVIFAAGYLNRFHHPAQVIVQRYKNLDIKILNTAESGSVTFKIRPEELLHPPELYRIQHKKFWD